MQDKMYNVEFTPEALKDLENFDKQNQKRAIRTIRLFEQIGRIGVDSRPLDKDGLFEMKCDKIRIYFMYAAERLIIIGLIVLKKTQKAPERYKLQARTNIQKYLELVNKE